MTNTRKHRQTKASRMNAHQATAADFDHLLLALASWVLLGCAVWAVLICVAAVLEVASRGRLAATTWMGCPAGVRRVLLAGLGVALVSTPGAAANTASRSTEGGGAPGSTSKNTLPAPARPDHYPEGGPLGGSERPGRRGECVLAG